jgi:hypothetical protein
MSFSKHLDVALLPEVDRSVPRLCRRPRQGAALLFLFWLALCSCQSGVGSILCHDGNGAFDSQFRTGVTVHVGAARERGPTTLATRACAAKLGWEEQEQLVATDASQLDLDAFGVDFGDGVPTAAFQIKKSDTDCCVEYRIYSLEKPPRLRRTITGGGFFSASDTDLDGRIEIWTNDSAAVNGLENLTLRELDSAPTIVLRFEHTQLMDVSAEFQPYFDGEIARIRSEIREQDLQDFKSSDGKLTETSSISPERLHQLRPVKIKVLEIIWAYLYSGREQEAWHSLADMWPSADSDRVRVALRDARANGIHHQADGMSLGTPPRKKKQAHVFDAVSQSKPSNKVEVIPPKAILLQRPQLSNIHRRGQPLLLDLIVDEAGKVRSADPAGKEKWADPQLISSAMDWKFIPAFKDGRAVASHVRIAVSPRE